MPRSDAVNEGLLACPLCRSDKIALGKRYSEDNGNEPAVRCMGCGCQATLKAWNTRAVPSPDTGPVVSIKPMALSDGRKDYFVSIKVGGREVTPHVFREEFKAAYHVALYDWLLNGSGEEPEIMDFSETDWPARIVPPSPDTVGVREAHEAFDRMLRRNVINECINVKIFMSGGLGGRSDDWIRGFDAGTNAFIEALEKLKPAALSPSHCTAARREEIIRECAAIAKAHKGSACKRRRQMKLKPSQDSLEEILTEERGEDIAAEIIEREILALTSEQSGPTAGANSFDNSGEPT